MRKAAARAALIGAMLGGGLLYAGISQAEDTGVQAERSAELIAATGGPAPADHLIPYEADKAAVDVREDDVEAQSSAQIAKTAEVKPRETEGSPQSRTLVTAQAAPSRP